MHQNKTIMPAILVLISILFFVFLPQANTYAEKMEDQNVKNWIENQPKQEEVKKTSDEQRQPASQNQEETTKVGITALDVMKTLFSLLFVLALLFIILKWIQKKDQIRPASHMLKNLGGIQLSSNRSIQMVKAGNSVLIIGVGENVQVLKEISNQEEIDAILAEDANDSSSSQQVTTILARLLKRVGKKEEQNTQSFKKLFDEQMNAILDRRKEVMKIETKGSNDE